METFSCRTWMDTASCILLYVGFRLIYLTWISFLQMPNLRKTRHNKIKKIIMFSMAVSIMQVMGNWNIHGKCLWVLLAVLSQSKI